MTGKGPDDGPVGVWERLRPLNTDDLFGPINLEDMVGQSWQRDPDERRRERPLRPTKRGLALLILLALLVGLVLGLTASSWNPYTRDLDRRLEDGSYRGGVCEVGALCDDSLDT